MSNKCLGKVIKYELDISRRSKMAKENLRTGAALRPTPGLGLTLAGKWGCTPIGFLKWSSKHLVNRAVFSELMGHHLHSFW